MMLNRVKIALRVTHNKLDEELKDLIEVVKCDLSISGVKKIDESDPLIYQAIKTYIKSEYESDAVKSEKFKMSYDMLKQHLALCMEYTEGVESEK